MASKFEMRTAFMPYCLKRLEDGRYVVLNRWYKPVGLTAPEWVDYDTFAVRLTGMKRSAAKKLSCDGDPDLENIYLYNDSCTPTRTDLFMRNYLKRLGRLAKLTAEVS